MTHYARRLRPTGPVSGHAVRRVRRGGNCHPLNCITEPDPVSISKDFLCKAKLPKHIESKDSVIIEVVLLYQFLR